VKHYTSGPLTAYDGGGDASAPSDATGFVTLDADTHYFPIPFAFEAEHLAVQILTDATIAGTFTVETTEFPAQRGDGIGPADVADYSEDAGKWVKLDVDAAGYAQGSGTGWTVTKLTLVKTAGAGGAVINLPHAPGRRYRLAAVITTGGTVRVGAHAKG
jgi:hypothetical protein